MVNVVTGGNDTGQALVEHPDVRMVSLTGSTATGKKIMATAANTLKRVHLELGGKAPVIVFDDADVELVSAKASFAAICNTGQDCTAATRVYVEKSRYNDTLEAVVEAMRGVKVGMPFDDDTAMGPLSPTCSASVCWALSSAPRPPAHASSPAAACPRALTAASLSSRP